MADNPVIGGVSVASKDIAGNQHFKQVIADWAGADALGLVGADPGAFTLLGRLKTIADAVGNQAAFLDGVEALLTTLGANTDTLEALTAANTAAINALATPDYETVAAASADAVLGNAGAAGDMLASITITPLTLSPGAVTLKDGAAGGVITLFAGGADSVKTLHPFTVPLGMVAGTRWLLTTGANVSVIAVGNFT